MEWPVEGAMYCSELRDQVTLFKEPDAILNQRRSQFLVPGSQLPETSQEARLPLLLLSQPPSSAGAGLGETDFSFNFIIIIFSIFDMYIRSAN